MYTCHGYAFSGMSSCVAFGTVRFLQRADWFYVLFGHLENSKMVLLARGEFRVLYLVLHRIADNVGRSSFGLGLSKRCLSVEFRRDFPYSSTIVQ